MDKDQFADGGGTLTAIGTYVGTPRYTSPEQAASEKVSGKTDVYSLGVVAFEVLTGRAAFEGTNPMALLAAHMKDVPPSIRTLRPDVDAHFAALVDRCLAKDPAARPDASEIASFLVPEPQAAMEWPPPGLDDLRGQAARAARAFNWFGGFAALFILALATQPTRGTTQWIEFERSLVWSVVANMWAGTGLRDTPDATPVWLFVLFLSLAGASIAFVVYVARSVRLFTAVRHGRRQGYSFQVLAAVAADDHADTSQLLNRSGRFAVLSTDQQQRLVKARRSAVVVLPGALLIMCVLMMNWFGGLLGGAPETFFGTAHVLVVLLPVVAGLLLRAYLFALELPLRGGSLWAGPARMSARAEFVRDWLSRLKNPDQLRFAPAALVIPAIGLVAGVAMLFALFVSAWALTVASRNVASTSGRVAGLYRNDGWSQEDRRLVAVIERALTPLGDARGSSSDSSGRLLAIDAFAQVAHRAEHPTSFDSSDFARVLVDAQAARKALANLGSTIDTRAHVNEQHAQQLAFVHLRLFAGSADPARSTDANVDQFPPYSYPNEALLQEHAEGRLNVPWFATPGTEGIRRECADSVQRSTVAECRAIGYDLLRAGLRMILSPIAEEHDRGVALTQEGTALLARIARSTGDAALTRTAATVQERATAVHGRRWGGARERRFNLIWAHAGSLDSNSTAHAMARDPQLMPYERWLLMHSVVTAFCTNAREILFGVSPLRHELLINLSRGSPPRTVQWVRIHRAMIDRWIEDPAQEFQRVLPKEAARRRFVDVVKWVGFGNLHGRLRYCSSAGLVTW